MANEFEPTRNRVPCELSKSNMNNLLSMLAKNLLISSNLFLVGGEQLSVLAVFELARRLGDW